MSLTFQAETMRRRESGLRRISADDVRQLVDVPSVRRRPASPLVAVDRTQLAVGAGPFVPDRDSGLLQRAHVGLAAQEPEELVDDGLRVDLLRRQQRKALGQREAHLVAEHRERAGARAVVLALAVVAHMPHEIEVLAHRRRMGTAAAWQGLARQAGTGNAEALNCSVSRAQCGSLPRLRALRTPRLGEEAMHPPNQFDLLAERRFAPFFWTQFLGAGNDNVYKNALVIFVAFHAATLTSLDTNALVNLAGAVFIAPFVLFSATAGQLADKFEKSRLIRWIKLFEIAIMAIGLAGFWRRDLDAALHRARAARRALDAVRSRSSTRSCRSTLKPEELIGGNGLVEMGTFVAILIGTIVGGLVVAIEASGPVLAGAVAVAIAVAGYLDEPRASRRCRRWIPGSRSTGTRSPKPGRTSRIAHEQPRRLAVDARHLLVLVLRRDLSGPVRRLRARHRSAATSTSSRCCSRCSRSASASARCSASGSPDARVELGLVPFGSIGLTVFAVDLWLASRNLHASGLAGSTCSSRAPRTGAWPPTSC